MANTIITPSVLAKRTLATLYNQTVFAGLVYRDYEADFTGKQGDTITVRKPAVFEGKDFNRNTGIEIQNGTEDSFTVTLDKIADVSFAMTAEDWTLKVDDVQERFVMPAAEAIVQKVDGEVAEKLVDAAESVGGGGTATWTGSKPSTVFTGETGAVAKLGRNKAPLSQRAAVWSPEAAGVALSDSLFVEADKSGSTDGLREASIGRTFGFDNYMSQALGFGSGDKGQADAVAFHRDAVALTSRTLQLPRDSTPANAAIENFKGLGLRVVWDYDIKYKQDVCSVDFLYGLATPRKEFAVQLSLALGS